MPRRAPKLAASCVHAARTNSGILHNLFTVPGNAHVADDQTGHGQPIARCLAPVDLAQRSQPSGQQDGAVPARRGAALCHGAGEQRNKHAAAAEHRR